MSNLVLAKRVISGSSSLNTEIKLSKVDSRLGGSLGSELLSGTGPVKWKSQLLEDEQRLAKKVTSRNR